jgi:RecA/RadA recombinase
VPRKKKAAAAEAAAPAASTGDKKLDKTLAEMRKKYKGDVLTTIAGGASFVAEGISTGFQELDDILTGSTDKKGATEKGSGVGMPKGRIIEIYGKEACLDAGTYIQYQVRRADDSYANAKGGTIERLYERFHGLLPSGDGRGKYQRNVTEDCWFSAPCVNEEGRIFHNRIVDVVKTGEQACFEVETESGARIVATADHKFLVGSRFRPLKKLKIGDPLMLHDCTPWTVWDANDGSVKEWRSYWFVKNHPVAGDKVVRDKSAVYAYKRLARSRAVVEADMNGLTLAEYRARLDSGEIDGLSFLSRDQHVHHLNEDFTDDRRENLVVLEESEHLREHAIERHNNLRFVVTEDRVRSIRPVGMRSTYDLHMESPYNNYVANDLVVHNSGKSTLVLMMILAVQKAGGRCALVDAEHSLDPRYAASIGVDLNTLYISQPDSAEQALDITSDLAKSGAFDFIAVDSIAALAPQDELDDDMADAHVALQARLISKAMRKLVASVKKKNVILVCVNQVRMKIGVKFGSPWTATGGNSLKFYASIRLDITKTKTLKKGEKKIGIRSQIYAAKNKAAPPFRMVHAEILHNQGIVKLYEDPDLTGDDE